MTGERNGGGHADSQPHDVDALRTDEESGDRSADRAAGSLAREVYWAAEGVATRPSDVGSLRERLDTFTHQLRIEQQQRVPIGEALLGSATGWKRRAKLVVWRLTRFSTMRYDRLIADLAELNGELAQRLRETQEEVTRLREQLEGREGGHP